MFNLSSSAHLGRRRRNLVSRTARTATRPLRFENLERRIVLTADIVGGGSFATIQQAINNAAPGDQIDITPGIYAENIDLSDMGSAIGQGPGDLTLRGTGAGVTINWAAGRAMINSSAFAGDLTIDAIGITSQTNTGLDLDQYAGTLRILNSNFNANQENGIELSNATGSIVIVDSQVIDMGKKGIRLDTVENVLIDNVTIDGGGTGNQDGIFGRDVSGVEIRNSTIRDIGDNVAHDAIDLKDTLGTVIIRDNSFERIGDDAVQIETNGTVQAVVTVSGNTVLDNIFGGGIELRTNKSAIIDATISDNTLDGLNDHAIELALKGASQLTAFVSDNRASNIGVESAIRIEAEDSSVASIVALRNIVSDTDGNGMLARALDTSELDVVIQQNVFSDIGDGTSDNALQLQSKDSATILALVEENVVNTVQGDAYQLKQSDSSVFDIVGVEATAQAVVENNNVGTPVTVTGTINVVAPPSSFVDANNDGRFTAGVDIALELGEISDGSFDTRETEGGYTTVIAGAGLVINGAPITGGDDLKYSADGDLVVNTDLTAGDEIRLTSRAGSVLLDDPTITAPDEIELEAALDIISTDDVIEATGSGSEVELKAGRDILLFGTSVTADREVELRAGESIVVGESLSLPGSLTASDPSRGEVELRAGSGIDVSGAEIVAGDEIQLIAGGSIFAIDSIMSALGNSRSEIELRAAGDIVADGALLSASDEVEVRSDGGGIFAPSATMEALGNSNGEVQLIAAGDIVVEFAVLSASRDVELRARGGSIFAFGATMNALGHSKAEVELRADTGDIDVNGAILEASDEVQLIAAGSIFASGTTIEALGNSKAEIEMRAGGDIIAVNSLLMASDEIDLRAGGLIDASSSVLSATGNSRADIILIADGDVILRDFGAGPAVLSASDEIKVRSTHGSIEATAAFFTADEVELEAALDIFYCAARVFASELELEWGRDLFDDAC